MRALYQYGYERARTGGFWFKAPPSDGRLASGPDHKSSIIRQAPAGNKTAVKLEPTAQAWCPQEDSLHDFPFGT
jgi:hypothetical protein